MPIVPEVFQTSKKPKPIKLKKRKVKKADKRNIIEISSVLNCIECIICPNEQNVNTVKIIDKKLFCEKYLYIKLISINKIDEDNAAKILV